MLRMNTLKKTPISQKQNQKMRMRIQRMKQRRGEREIGKNRTGSWNKNNGE